MKEFANILFTVILLLLPGLVLSQSTNTLEQAKTALGSGDYQQAITVVGTAGEMYLQSEQFEDYLLSQSILAEANLRLSKLDETITIAEQAAQNTNTKVDGQSPYLAKVYQLQGEAYLNKGRTEQALEYTQKSVEGFSGNGEAARKELALTYNNLGLIYWNTQNLELAKEHQLKALSIRQELLGENHEDVAGSYNNLGLIYLTEDADQALDYYEKALNIYKSVLGENSSQVANAYINTGIAYRQLGFNAVALDEFEGAQKIYESTYNQDHPVTAFVYSNIGITYTENSEYGPARDFLQRALRIYKNQYGNKHPEVANTYNALGTMHNRAGEYQQALDNYQQAIIANMPNFSSRDPRSNPSVDQYYNGDLLLTSMHLKAQTFEALHFGKTLKLRDLISSLDALEACDKLIDNLRQLKANEKDKISLGRTAAEVYEDAVRVSHTLGQVAFKKKGINEKAFYFAEKSKSAVLLDAISDSEAKDFAGIPREQLDKEKSLKADITFYEQLLAKNENPEREQQYRNELFTLNNQYRDFVQNLERSYPEYYNLKFSTASASVSDVQSVLAENSALVSYFVATKSNRLYIFTIGKKEFDIYNIEKTADFDRFISGVRNTIRYDVEGSFLETSAALYKQIFPKRLPNSVTSLIIIPDGRLGTLPFEALVTQKVKEGSNRYDEVDYLVEDYSISYDYSATLFTQKTATSASSRNDRIFLCAPIEFQYGELRLPTLPASEAEVNEIDKMFKQAGYGAQIFANNSAREGVVKSEEIKGFKYLHFATHGIVNESRPELSKIFLSGNNDDNEDGNLFSGEIYNLSLNADLITLSACQTGLGKISRGEGIIGLSRALIYAGAKNLVVSLWSVADQSTADLMVDFYGHLIEGNQHYTGALRQAKLDMINGKTYANPYYWAPFILIGK